MANLEPGNPSRFLDQSDCESQGPAEDQHSHKPADGVVKKQSSEDEADATDGPADQSGEGASRLPEVWDDERHPNSGEGAEDTPCHNSGCLNKEEIAAAHCDGGLKHGFRQEASDRAGEYAAANRDTSLPHIDGWPPQITVLANHERG